MFGYLKSNWIIALIFLFVVGIRLYNVFEFGISHDELSSLLSVQNYPTLHSLIKDQIFMDMHPGGHLLLLHFFTNVFGYSLFVIRLPSLLFAFASFWLLYHICVIYFNRTTAVVVCSLYASLQYFIVYSIIARPYASGLFYALLLFWFWAKICLEKSTEKKYTIGAGLAFMLCISNHYFTLFYALALYAVGLVFYAKNNWKNYLVSGIVGLSFSIPFVPIIYNQLQHKGLGWLGRPDNLFIANFFKYSFHYSFVFIVLAWLFALWGVYAFFSKRNKNYLAIVCFLLFLASFLFGFLYSKFASPIIQFSSLYFTFPFLLIAFFSHLKSYSNKVFFFISIGIIGISTASLVYNRNHFAVQYRSFFSEITEVYSAYEMQFPHDVYMLAENEIAQTDYYLSKTNIDTSTILKDENTWSDVTLENKLRLITKNYLIYAVYSPWDGAQYSIIKKYFPYAIKQKNYQNGTIYVFSKKISNTIIKPLWEKQFSNISFAESQDSIPLFHAEKPLPFNDKNNYVDAVLKITRTDSMPIIATLVMEVSSGKYTISKVEKNLILLDEKNNTFFACIKLAYSSFDAQKPTVVNCFVRNKKSNGMIESFDLQIRQGNAVENGFTELFKTALPLDLPTK